MDHILVDSVEEREDIVDFINYVFSQAHCPHNFKTLIPKAYGDENQMLGAEHYYIKKEGKIKALVANRPTTLCVAGQQLKLGLIGSVSVHPYSRGEGYMKELMAYALNKAKANDTDLMVLGGQRQRYGYFGFEHGGTVMSFHVTQTNMRHCFAKTDCSAFSFADLKDADETTCEKLLALYNARPLHCVRAPEEFVKIMQTWKSTTWVVLKNGAPVGYCYGEMAEVVLENEDDFPLVLKAYFDRFTPTEITVPVSPFETGRIWCLTGICEDASIRQDEMIHVLNWKNVLQAFLDLKAMYTHLSDGMAKFSVDGQCYQICVQDGIPAVTEIETEEGMRQLGHNQAQVLFFGVQSGIVENVEFKNWLPLPFRLDRPDEF